MNPVALWRAEGAPLRRMLLFQLCSNLGAGVFALLFNLYLLALGYREDVIGLAAGLNTLGQGLAALAAGRLVVRLGAPRTMALALACFTAASAAQAVVTGRVAIALLALGVGAATSWLTIPVMPYLSEQISREAHADAAALTFAVQNLSVTAGTLLGGLLPAGLALAGLGLVSRDRLALLIGIGVGALGLLPLFGMAGGAGAPHRARGTAVIGPELDGTPRRVRRTVWGYAGAAVLLSIGAGAFMPFVNVYLDRLGASQGAIGAILAATGAVGAALGLLAPAVARRFGSLRAAAVLRALPVPCALALAAVPALGLVVATQAARQVGANMAWAVEVNVLSERVPGRALASAFGLRLAAWNLSWAAISIISGQLIVHGGYNTPLYILAGATALGAGALWWALDGGKKSEV
ncbi:MAG TPA: MFS transporter [Thermomicrobiales bacterium]|nr:MFS transporter [Thermomicrobiales bacterium]